MIYNTLIIGGGISGIFTLKHLIEEGEKNVIILNKNPEPFGVWNMKNHPSVMDFTYSVSSRLYMTISDFPIDKDMPEFPHHSKILDYYKKYAQHFDLYKYIKNNIEVLKVKKLNDIWSVETTGGNYKCINLVVATGAVNSCLNFPDDHFFKNFTGEKKHCDNFMDYEKNLVNKNILIVGGSDTSCDIANYLADKNKVTLSMKNGRWFQPRFLGASTPADAFYSRTIDFTIKNIVGKKYANDYIGDYFIKRFFGKYGSGIKEWEAKCDYLNDYYVKSRDVVDAIAKGKIEPKGSIEDINKKLIKFNGDKEYKKYDTILFCTGYNTKGCFKFLDKNYDKKYKFIFSPEEPKIFFVGFIRPYLTSIPMLSELQSRWVAKVITNKVKLPDPQTMNKDIQLDFEKMKKEFPCSYRRLPIVDPYDYCNMIAKNIGAYPNLTKIFFKEHKLWRNIMLDTWNHHFFRLNDSDTTKVKNAKDNINHHSNKGTSEVVRNSANYYLNTLLIIILIIIGAIVLIGLSIYFYKKYKPKIVFPRLK